MEGADTITDFELGIDVLTVQDAIYIDLTFVDTGSGTLVDWGTGSVEFTGVDIAALTEDNFSFV